ncbi:efflux RND transporter permease subunit [Paenibacillus sp. y28]|uniref:efflux RND transporter permease subunit n=1 Tax=Paenibacillus sp. y28 TaxID=3129110 RepID=UPI00301B46A7
MNRITQFSMKNVSALFIIMLLLFGSGIFAADKLKVENMPNISFPMVMVSATYTGAPKDVMEEVTKPIEEKLANIEDLDSLSSTSSDNNATIRVQFKQGVDTEKKKQDIESLMQEVALPASASTPKVSTFGVSSMASNYLVINGADGMSQTDLNKRYEDHIEPNLEALKGLDHIDVIGSSESSLDIELDADALSVFGMTPSQVTTAINAALTKTSIGSVKLNGDDKMARVRGDLNSLQDLEQLEITTSKGDIVTLSQLANVRSVTESSFIGRMDGQPAIGIILYKSGSANAIEFSDALTKLTDGWKTSLPNVIIKSTYDSSIEIRESIHGLLREGIVGALLSSLMILVFLRNVRMTLIVLVSIPLSILITLLLMWEFDLTLNTMTLGGMFIAVGRVVDDAIVVIENVYSSLEKAQERKESVILLATKQVASAITSSTLATVSVFAPIGFISGTVGELFRPFAITLACALLSSLLVALTVIPMLAKLLVLRSKIKPHASHENAQPGWFMRIYEGVLQWCLKHRYKTLLISAALFVVTVVTTVPMLKLSFIPSSKPSNIMYFQLKLPYETSFSAMNEKSKELETLLMDAKDTNGDKLFKFVEALIGYNRGSDQVPYMAQIYVEVNENVDADKVKQQTKNFLLSELPQGSEVTPRSIGGGGGFSSTDFSYNLKSEDQDKLEAAAAMVKEKLETIPELSEVEDSLSNGKSEIEIIVDKNKARAYGLNASTVRDTARTWIQKQSLGDSKLDNYTYTTTVSMDLSDKDSLEKLGNIPLTSTGGSKVYLKEVAKIVEVQSAASLQRESQSQLLKVTAKINAEDKQGVSMKVSRELASLQLPDGVQREVKGVSSDINESFSQLYLAMAVAVAVVYLIMVLAFGNASAPFAILFSLPLAAIGGLLGLVLSGEALSVTSMIGFMMLIGIVVTNAIVLIDRAQQLREEGYTVREALLEAGKVRLRPIIMTAGATIMALIPLALGISGEGGLIGKGLGVVVIGGLITSTLLTLVVVPIVYELIEGFKNWASRLFGWNKNHAESQIGTMDV